jgi:hypothetical protein
VVPASRAMSFNSNGRAAVEEILRKHRASFCDFRNQLKRRLEIYLWLQLANYFV